MADVIALADVIAMFCVLFLLLRLMFFYLNIEYVSCINKYRQMLKPWLMLLPMFCSRCFKPQRQIFLTSFVHARLMLLPVVVLCGRCHTT